MTTKSRRKTWVDRGLFGMENGLRTFVEQLRERAQVRSPATLCIVFLLTLSLALDGIAGWGFVPGLYNGQYYINFVIHEFGHLATILLPRPIHVASGTLFQLALPALSIRMFIRQRDDAAACFAACWLTASLMHSAWYIGDARAQEADPSLSQSFWSLTLGAPTNPDHNGHDWFYMLGGCGLLEWDTTLERVVQMLAGTIAVFAVAIHGAQVWFSFADHRVRSRRTRIRE